LARITVILLDDFSHLFAFALLAAIAGVVFMHATVLIAVFTILWR
jgi:hypothetical protein